jgi:hypothetical protein
MNSLRVCAQHAAKIAAEQVKKFAQRSKNSGKGVLNLLYRKYFSLVDENIPSYTTKTA